MNYCLGETCGPWASCLLLIFLGCSVESVVLFLVFCCRFFHNVIVDGFFLNLIHVDVNFFLRMHICFINGSKLEF